MKNILSNREVMQDVRTRVLTLLARRNGAWRGTMTDLFEAITPRRTPEVWPGSASSLRRLVDNVTPALRREGYRVKFTRTSGSKGGRRLVSFTKVR